MPRRRCDLNKSDSLGEFPGLLHIHCRRSFAPSCGTILLRCFRAKTFSQMISSSGQPCPACIRPNSQNLADLSHRSSLYNMQHKYDQPFLFHAFQCFHHFFIFLPFQQNAQTVTAKPSVIYQGSILHNCRIVISHRAGTLTPIIVHTTILHYFRQSGSYLTFRPIYRIMAVVCCECLLHQILDFICRNTFVFRNKPHQ